MQLQGEGKRSTLVRDILIGVAIAALVLGGFFVVKILFLDKKDEPAAPESTIATIHISMASGGTATLLVDDKNIATVSDGKDIPVSAGKRHVVLVGSNGGKCETTVTLEAGKTTPLKCQLAAAPAPIPPVPATGSATGSATATGSAAATGSATVTPAAGSAAGSVAGSAAGSAAPPPLPPLPPWLTCGEVGTYSQLNKKRAKPKFERDHVPSHAAMNKAAQSSPKMENASKG